MAEPNHRKGAIYREGLKALKAKHGSLNGALEAALKDLETVGGG